jgi:two-component sensor histidine kinase
VVGGKLSRRVFLLTLSALVPVVVILFYNLYEIRSAKEQEIHEDALRAANLASLEMQRIIGGVHNLLTAIAAAPVVRNGDRAGCQDYLARLGAELPQFSGIAVVDDNGVILCRQEEAGVGLSLVDRHYFREARETRRFVVGEYAIGRISKSAMVPLVLPFADESGTFGAVIGALSLDWLGQRLRERDYAQSSALTIADREGVILAREPFPERFVGTRIPAPFVSLVKAEQPGTMVVDSQDGTRRVLGYYPPVASGSGLYISAGISTASAYAAVRNALWVGLAGTLISLVLSFFLAWMTSRRLIQRPVSRLVETIRAWRAGDVSARTGMGEAGGEFGIVGQAIDGFLDELAEARQSRVLAEQQRQLLMGELDHRVRNLLATVQSVARQTFRDHVDPETAAETFSRRLAAMGDAHTLLRREDWQAAGMRSIVEVATQPFSDEDRTQISIDGPDIPVWSKAVLSLSMALHELATNASKYGALSRSEGRVSIRWAVEGDRVVMVWRETGGPEVKAQPSRQGFGSRMIERVLAYQLAATVAMDFAPSGLVCTVSIPIDQLRGETMAAAS